MLQASLLLRLFPPDLLSLPPHFHIYPPFDGSFHFFQCVDSYAVTTACDSY